MNNSKKYVRQLKVGSVSALALLALGNVANASPLFSQQGAEKSSPKAHIQSTRDVKINQGALNQSRLEFLLDGTPVTAVRTKLDKRQGRFQWIGHIQGNTGESVVITAHKNAISGVIHHNGASYELRGSRNGQQSLGKVAFDRLPLEDIGGVPDGGGVIPTTEDAGTLAEAVQQDLMIVYTQGACDSAANIVGADCSQIEADIQTAVADMNLAYTESGINIFSNVTSIRKINYNDAGVSSGTMLGELRLTNDGIMDEVHTWRNEDGADLVALIANGTGCGIAYSPASESSAFSVTDESCLVGNRTMSHEIGHNQGALHDRDQHSDGISGNYNYGFKRCSDGSDEDFGAPYFRTVMSYSCAGAPRVGRYSNPNITYLGVPQGIDPNVNPARGAFNARRLNETATNVAGFRGSVVVQLPPASPSALSVSADGAAAVNISWSDNSDNESSFSVERSLDNINFSEIGIVSANTTSYNDNGLLSETTYYYRVKASNNAGASSYSNTGTVTTEAQPSTVESVASSQTLGIGTVSGGFANTHTDNGAIQRITEVSSGGPKRNRTQSYRHTYRFDNIGGAGGAMLSANAYISGSEGAVFEYSANGGSSWTLMFTVSSQSSANTESFAFPGGASGTVLVRVRDAAQTRGESADSVSIDSLVITSSTVVGAPPSAPSGLTVTSVAGSSVALRYSDNSDNEFGFEIWRGLTSGVCKTGTMVGTASTNQTSYTDNTASASTTYFYDVSAFNGGGSSANCAGEVSVTTDAAPAISASARGYKVKGRQTVDVTWTGTSGSSVQVYRNSSPITTANDGAYTDSIGIKGGGSYSYKVCETGSTTACSSTVSVIF